MAPDICQKTSSQSSASDLQVSTWTGNATLFVTPRSVVTGLGCQDSVFKKRAIKTRLRNPMRAELIHTEHRENTHTTLTNADSVVRLTIVGVSNVFLPLAPVTR